MLRLFLFLFIIGFSYSQNNITITYKKFINDNFSIKKDASSLLKSKFNLLKKTISIPTYQLIIDKDKSKFKLEEILELDRDISLKEAIYTLNGKSTFYIDIKKDSIFEYSEYNGKTFFVRYPISNYTWKIKDSTKTILGYQCFKATTVINIDDLRGKYSFNYYAWFTPELPANFGPADLRGLPGAILEAGTKSFYYKATKVSYKNKSVNLPKLKSITELEYEDYFRKALNINGK